MGGAVAEGLGAEGGVGWGNDDGEGVVCCEGREG